MLAHQTQERVVAENLEAFLGDNAVDFTSWCVRNHSFLAGQYCAAPTTKQMAGYSLQGVLRGSGVERNRLTPDGLVLLAL